jgi:hypothetical protein
VLATSCLLIVWIVAGRWLQTDDVDDADDEQDELDDDDDVDDADDVDEPNATAVAQCSWPIWIR